MKTLLPILKTKLVLLSFVFACTAILANNYIQRENPFKFSEAKEEKVIAEPSKVPVKTKRVADKKINLRLDNNMFRGAKSSFTATIQTDKRDYMPGDIVTITGSGWEQGETVNLYIVSDCGCTDLTLTAIADPTGNITNSNFLITEAHLHTYFSLVAEGSNSIAENYFTDAIINTGGSGNWSSTVKNAPWPGTGSTGVIPATTDDIVVGPGHTLTVDGNRTCNSIALTDGATLVVNPGVTLTVTGDVFLQNLTTANSSATITGSGIINAASLTVVNQDGNGGVGDFAATLNCQIANLNLTGNITINSNQGNNTNRNRNGVFNISTGVVTVTGGIITDNEAAQNNSTLTLTTTAPENALLNIGGATPFTLDGTGTNTITLDGDAATVNYYRNGNQSILNTIYTNLEVNGTGEKSLGGAATNVNGTMTVNGTFANGGGIQLGGTGHIVVNSGGGFRWNAQNVPNISGTKTFDANSTFEYYRNDIQNIAAYAYGHLVLTATSGSRVKSLTGPTIVNGNLTIGANNDLTAGTNSISLKRNWTNNGTFSAGTSTLTMNGTSAQTMIGSTFYNLVIDNVAGVTLNSAATVSNNLAITSGSSLNLNTFTHSAGTLTLGSDGSVNGSWGHSSSPATYTNDVFFANATGIVNVTTSTCPNPTISDQPDDILNACVGNNAVFNVTASGPGSISYQWYKENGGTDITLVNGPKYSGATSASLTINNLVAGDAGDYYVIVTRSCGSTITSSDATLSMDNVPPAITCPGTQTVTLDASCNGTLGDYISLATASDACGSVTITQSPAAGSPANGTGSVTVTLTARDASNNTNACTFTVNKVDVTAPAITCPGTQTVTLDANCNGTLGDYISLATASDACSPVTITQSPAAGSPANGTGSVTVTLTARDASNNTNACTFTVNKVDVTAPAITCPGTQTVTLDASCNGTLGDYISLATASDACSPVTITQSPAAGSPANGTGSVTVTLTARDASNNTNACTFTVNKVDVTAPAITCPGTQTVTLDASCNGTLGDYISLATASDACSPVTITQSPAAGSPANGTGSITVTLTARDASNNTNACTFTVNKVDVTPPTFTTINTNTGLGCNPTASVIEAALGTATATDACSTTTVTSSDVETGTCAKSKTRTFTARDASGNTSTASVTVTWSSDLTPPNVGITADKSSLWPPNHKMVDIIINPTASDGCGTISATTLVVTSNEPANDIGDGNTEEDIAWTGGVVQPGEPYTVKGPITLGTDNRYHIQLRAERSGVNAETGRIYTIKYIATDACGNTNSASTQVTVAHNITNPSPGNAVEINTTVNLAGTFWDVPGKTHTAKWVVDGTTINGIVTAEPSGNKMGKVTGTFKPTVAGVYKLRMNVTDQTGITSYATTSGDYEAYFVVFDPKGGFTYGGGQFISPAAALPARPDLTSTVTFGFASNYYKNATNPKGETQIDLKLTDGDYSFAFNALNYDYLVTNGANATYKGLGKTTINGVEQSGLAFILKVIDGKTASNPDGVDMIRMKIYNKNTGAVIYDNQMGASETADPTTPVDQPNADGTDIVVVSNPATTTNITVQNTQMETVAPETFKFNVKVFPNPTEHQFTLVLDGATNEKVSIVVYDVMGRQVKMFEKESANIPIRFGADLKVGAYVVEVRQGENRKTLKLVKQ